MFYHSITLSKPGIFRALLVVAAWFWLFSFSLVEILGSSGITSEVIKGTQEISKVQAQILAGFFQVETELFI
ncbi:hypothetical protein [Tolypothrix sp. VBCCA 56010]|uniref:hypothetical protein n=1 Tax=Tolypothrix sp. VBCCA 56010 TaxID=3137731 RepID=UPI003D7EEF37